MKSFIVILAIFATIHQISAQDNPLLDVLERVTVLYNEFADYNNVSRYLMGSNVEHVSRLTMEAVLDEIGTWNIKLKGKCPTTFNSEAQGAVVEACSNTIVQELSVIQDNMFDILEELSVEANAISTSVVQELGEFNIITGYEDFDSQFDPILADFRSRLDGYALRVGEVVAELAAALHDFPERTRECINAGFVKLHKAC
uniref:Uncharacterized protein n=1 Tax=Phlebotomus papatasi TaxID=29031 RepID=A0A1B0DFE2_PHLPP